MPIVNARWFSGEHGSAFGSPDKQGFRPIVKPTSGLGDWQKVGVSERVLQGSKAIAVRVA